MASATAANTFSLLILCCAIVFFAIAFFFFSAAVFTRLNFLSRRRRLDPLVASWRRRFEGEDGSPAPAVHFHDAFTVLNLWNTMHHTRLGEEAGKDPDPELTAIGLSLGFVRVASALLRDGDDNDRIVALTTLGFLADTSAGPEVRRLLASRNGDVSFAAFRALVLMDRSLIESFIDAIAVHADWSLTATERFLRALGPAAISPPFVNVLERIDDDRVIDLLRYLPLCSPDVAHDAAIRKLTETERPAVAAAVLRAIGRIVRQDDRPVLHRLLAPEQPMNVRIASINALLPISDLDDHDLLVGLLGDGSYWVRYRAAQALMNLPEGVEEAQRLVDTIQDRYSKDILRQALAENAWDESAAIRSHDRRELVASGTAHRRHVDDAMRTEI